MIIQYSQLVKNKLVQLYGENSGYTDSIYNQLYLSGLAHIIPMLKYFAETISEDFIDRLFYKLTNETPSIEKLVSRGEIEICIYTSDTKFKLANSKGFAVYTKTTHSVTKEEKIYLLLLCIGKPYRKYGYGKVFMEEFLEWVSNSSGKSKRVILHSLDSSLHFYLSLGFTEIPDKITNYKKLFKFEKYDKESVLLEYKIQ